MYLQAWASSFILSPLTCSFTVKTHNTLLGGFCNCYYFFFFPSVFSQNTVHLQNGTWTQNVQTNFALSTWLPGGILGKLITCQPWLPKQIFSCLLSSLLQTWYLKISKTFLQPHSEPVLFTVEYCPSTYKAWPPSVAMVFCSFLVHSFK